MPTQEDLIAQELARTLGLQLKGISQTLADSLIANFLAFDRGNRLGFISANLADVEDAFDQSLSITEAINQAQGYLLLGEDFLDSPVSRDTVLGSLRGGIPSAEVYQRPFVDYFTVLKKAKELGGLTSDIFDQALDSAASRFRQIVDSDITRLSDLSQIEKFANEHGIIGYRRVLSGKPNHCALCVIASTQRYHKRNLRPMHPGCGCTTVPVLSFESEGDHILNQDLLDQLHQSIADEFGEDVSNRSARGYRDIMVTHNHGELGPVLSWRGQHFAGPSVLS